MVEVISAADVPLHLGAGSPLAKAATVHPAYVQALRLVSAPPNPQSPQRPATYEKFEGGFVPLLPSANSCLQPEELVQLRHLLHAFRDLFRDDIASRLASIRATPPVLLLPAPSLPGMRRVVRDAVADLDAKRITESSTGCWRAPIVIAPAIFQRMVDMLPGGMKWVGYIDDIIVYSDTWADHCAHLRQLLTTPSRGQPATPPGKVLFRDESVRHLGPAVSRKGSNRASRRSR
ncbi:hypothetical protein ACSSS7_004654 [Eimeria intestinalis]